MHITVPYYTADCAPTGIRFNKTADPYKKDIFWDDAPCDVDNYTVYYNDYLGLCQNKTVDGDTTTVLVSNGFEYIQVGAHLNDMTSCSQGMLSTLS